METFTVEPVNEFQGVPRERGASRAYQHRLHREVKAFFSWCTRLDLIEVNVSACVLLVKLEQQLVQPFSPGEVERPLEFAAPSTRMGKRDYAVILLLLDTGARAGRARQGAEAAMGGSDLGHRRRSGSIPKVSMSGRITGWKGSM